MGMLDGRVALVTGGSKGLGAATARLFAQAGARVVVTFGSDAQAADRLIASLPGTGPQSQPHADTGYACNRKPRRRDRHDRGPARHPRQQCQAVPE